MHGTAPTLRSGYSPRRITGHDPDIGTGNFVETNYPDIRVCHGKLFYSGAQRTKLKNLMVVECLM